MCKIRDCSPEHRPYIHGALIKLPIIICSRVRFQESYFHCLIYCRTLVAYHLDQNMPQDVSFCMSNYIEPALSIYNLAS